jgi:hypothetical protein
MPGVTGNSSTYKRVELRGFALQNSMQGLELGVRGKKGVRKFICALALFARLPVVYGNSAPFHAERLRRENAPSDSAFILL